MLVGDGVCVAALFKLLNGYVLLLLYVFETMNEFPGACAIAINAYISSDIRYVKY